MMMKRHMNSCCFWGCSIFSSYCIIDEQTEKKNGFRKVAVLFLICVSLPAFPASL